MARQTESDDHNLLEAKAVMTGALGMVSLGVLAFFVSPAFRSWLLIIAALLGTVLLGFVGYLLMPKAHKNGSPSTRSSQIPDNTEASSTHAARQPCRETSEPDIAEKLRNIDWYQFEKLVEIIYRNRGLSVLRLGGANLEGGVDLIAASPTEKFVVQCRHWRNRTLGVRQIRDFLGILADCKIDKGILVTLGDCTDEASQLARKHGIQILNETELTAMLVESGLINDEKVVNLFDDKNKYCPKCERPMVLRTASIKGTQIWGCSYFPSCTFSMKLES